MLILKKQFLVFVCGQAAESVLSVGPVCPGDLAQVGSRCLYHRASPLTLQLLFNGKGYILDADTLTRDSPLNSFSYLSFRILCVCALETETGVNKCYHPWTSRIFKRILELFYK